IDSILQLLDDQDRYADVPEASDLINRAARRYARQHARSRRLTCVDRPPATLEARHRPRFTARTLCQHCKRVCFGKCPIYSGWRAHLPSTDIAILSSQCHASLGQVHSWALPIHQEWRPHSAARESPRGKWCRHSSEQSHSWLSDCPPSPQTVVASQAVA